MKIKPASNKADGIRMALIDGLFMNRVISIRFYKIILLMLLQ